VSFSIRRVGERHEGWAPGIDRRLLVRLRRGETPVEAEVDLHGLDRRGGEAALRRALANARAEGVRCVLVVHGRGTHSQTGAVLRDAVVAWLTAPPLASAVMAFASALPRDGGAGATYVLLRRVRTPRPASA
jgi:DNA-nicking Smr family endonuclease